MTRDEVAELIDALIVENPPVGDTGLRVADLGEAPDGQCVPASDIVADWLLGRGAVGVAYLELASDKGWGGHGTSHSVVQVEVDDGHVIVDLTANQFTLLSRFPLVARSHEYLCETTGKDGEPMGWAVIDVERAL